LSHFGAKANLGHKHPSPPGIRQQDTGLCRLGKPESVTKRRMGVALAFDADVEVARTHAKLAASKVKPRAA